MLLGSMPIPIIQLELPIIQSSFVKILLKMNKSPFPLVVKDNLLKPYARTIIPVGLV